jgi:DNA-entry nuclease
LFYFGKEYAMAIFLERKVKTVMRILICVVMMSFFFGCTYSVNETSTEQTERVTEEQTADEKTIPAVSEDDSQKENADDKTEISEATTEASVGTELVYPEYSGEAYIELNDNVPLFTDEEKGSTQAFESYSNLDKLGRCGVAFANICPELMPDEERGSIGDVRPSGWHTVKYPDLIEDNYLYNRSHLIAYSLAGENANEKNLITGTRFLNQETMQIFELRVLDYVRDTGNHVLYRVTPVFEGDNLLVSGVQMEAWSVEDSGKSICFNVYCYNVQPGIEIDYATGESKVADGIDIVGAADTTEATEEQTVVTTEATTMGTNSTSGSDFENQEMTFILNTNSKKIHLPDCRSVGDMAEHNKEECVSTLRELKERGYTPCGRCLAQYR